MIDEEIFDDVVKIVLLSIQEACADYFHWTRGRIVYDDGVESMMQVYAAKHLFEKLPRELEPNIRLEQPRREFSSSLTGRVDLSLKIGSLTIAIEFKRYLNPTIIKGDLIRQQMISKLDNHRGILAAPGFIRKDQKDWLPTFKEALLKEDPNRKIYLSQEIYLPTSYQHTAQWDRSTAIVIVVPA